MTIPRITGYPMPASLPVNRVDWRLESRRAVLLVHDMQDYFVDFYDRSAAPVPALMAHARRLIDAAHAQRVPVVYTAQRADQTPQQRGLLTDMWGPGLTARPDRDAIVAELKPQIGDIVLDKWRYSAFHQSPLLARMREMGRDQLIICGIYAHIGCQVTACEAFMHDIQPFFVADALADFSAEAHTGAMQYVAQRCGAVTDTEASVLALAASPASLPASWNELMQKIAGSLQLPTEQIGADDNLLDWGMDSIRIMTLVESWRRPGTDLTFAQLAEQPTAAAWWKLLQQPAAAH